MSKVFKDPAISFAQLYPDEHALIAAEARATEAQIKTDTVNTMRKYRNNVLSLSVSKLKAAAAAIITANDVAAVQAQPAQSGITIKVKLDLSKAIAGWILNIMIKDCSKVKPYRSFDQGHNRSLDQRHNMGIEDRCGPGPDQCCCQTMDMHGAHVYRSDQLLEISCFH